MTQAILSIRNLRKTYGTGVDALKSVNLDIQRGEIFALLGPNGAGKTTLINIVCGIVTSEGEVQIDGKNWKFNYRYARERIRSVPQELTTEAFESVWNTVSFSRGLFGKPRNDAYIEDLLRRLSLWDKRKSIMMHLSGGIKEGHDRQGAFARARDPVSRRAELRAWMSNFRRDMWDLVGKASRRRNETIILTTHYIEEAEEMADRVGVISRGELITVDEKSDLMAKMGRKTLDVVLAEPLSEVPAALSGWNLELNDNGHLLRYQFDSHAERTGIASLMRQLSDLGIGYKDLSTHQSSLEEIFVELVHGNSN